MTWAYDPHSRTVYTIDATESDDGVIARDVPPEFGALIAAAGEMREALLQISGAHFNCSMPQMWMPMQDCATQALRAVKTEPQP